MNAQFSADSASSTLPRVMDGVARAELERDVYWRMLELDHSPDPQPLLVAILECLVTVVKAQRGFLEIYGGEDRGTPHWALSRGCSAEEEREIRAVTSR